MTNSKVHFVVSLAINDGKLAQFQSIAQEMIAGTVKEAGALGYEWFLSADHKRCRLVETYVDPDAVMAHMSGPVVRDLVPKILETASLTSFEVYGDPGAEAAKTLAGIGAEIFPFWHGLKG